MRRRTLTGRLSNVNRQTTVQRATCSDIIRSFVVENTDPLPTMGELFYFYRTLARYMLWACVCLLQVGVLPKRINHTIALLLRGAPNAGGVGDF